MTVKILLADDHKVLREGLRSLLEEKSEMQVVGEAEDGATVVRLARQLRPDVVIMDVNMPGMDGIDATRHICSEQPDVKVIGLSMYLNKTFVTEMLNSGASGYILKDSAFADVVEAVQTVTAGRKFVCRKVAALLVDEYVRSSAAGQAGPAAAKNLTSRELEVVKLLAEGKPSKEIAMLTGTSVKTVDACRRRVMKKLGVDSLAALVKYAIREGLTSIES